MPPATERDEKNEQAKDQTSPYMPADHIGGGGMDRALLDGNADISAAEIYLHTFHFFAWFNGWNISE
jgi:hypothetical protein